MGWVYILIRVYPFWAIPIGAALATAAYKTPKAPPLRRWGYISLGMLMMLSGGLFLGFQGHLKAVPWMHEVLNTPLFPAYD